MQKLAQTKLVKPTSPTQDLMSFAKEESKNQATPEFGNKSVVFGTPETELTPLKPKKPMSAYLYFNMQFQQDNKGSGHDLPLLSKQAGEKWKSLSEEEKQKFVLLSIEDKVRYTIQKEEIRIKGYYTLADGTRCEGTSKSKPKQGMLKLPNGCFANKATYDLLKSEPLNALLFQELVEEPQPKRYVCSFQQFNHAYMKQLRALNDIPLTECVKAASVRWAQMNADERQPYEDLAAADKLRQERQKTELREKGFFVLQDGSKSTDEQNAVKVGKKRRRSENI